MNYNLITIYYKKTKSQYFKIVIATSCKSRDKSFLVFHLVFPRMKKGKNSISVVYNIYKSLAANVYLTLSLPMTHMQVMVF